MNGVKPRQRKPRSTFEIADFDREAAKKEESACVYFGPERLASVKARAEAVGQSLSGYVCAAVDASLGLPPALAAKLEALALLKNKSAADVLAGLVADAVKRA